MKALEKSTAQLASAIAVRELAVASLINSLADKIDQIPVSGNCLELLHRMHDLIKDTLTLSREGERSTLEILQVLNALNNNRA